MTSPSPSDDTVYVSFTAEFNSQTSEALLGFLGQLVNKGTKKVCLLLSKRWTPSFGQVFVTAKVESRVHDSSGVAPGLLFAPWSVYASSGVRSLSDEWGRRRL